MHFTLYVPRFPGQLNLEISS